MSPWQKFRSSFEEGLIYDSGQHRCGTLTGFDHSWIQSHDLSNCELVLLSYSQQRVVTDTDVQRSIDRLPLEYPSATDYYDEVFDAKYYSSTERWAMNVMLVEWIDGLAYRLAIGQLHRDAWEKSNRCRKMIMLV
jgi:hypothetical protein